MGLISLHSMSFPKLFILTLLIIISLTHFLADASEAEPSLEIIVINKDSLIEQHDVYSFTTEASVKKLLESQGIIPTTTNWMEVTLLCEKLYTHLKSERFKCVYEYSKIIENYRKVKTYCELMLSNKYDGEKLEIEFESVDNCIERYGFEDPKTWKSYKGPAIEASSKQNEIVKDEDEQPPEL